MESSPLSSQQRDVLIRQINRRIEKLPDETLIKLEEATRYSKHQKDRDISDNALIRSVPSVLQQRMGEPITQSTTGRWREESQSDQPNGLSRREALLISATGGLALLSTAVGTGWLLESNHLEETRSRINQLGDPNLYIRLENTLNRLTDRISSLKNHCDTTCLKKDDQDKVLIAYQAQILPTFIKISELRKITNEVSELNRSIIEDDVVKKLLEAIENRELTALYDFILALGTKIDVLVTYFQKVPELIQSSDQLLVQLNQWFSEQNNIDIRLLSPIHADLFRSVDEIRTQMREIQGAWQSEVTPVVMPAVDRLKDLRNDTGG